MNDKIYILLDTVDGKAEQVVQVLQEIPGVVIVEALEGPPNDPSNGSRRATALSQTDHSGPCPSGNND